MANPTSTSFRRFTAGAKSAAAVASGVALTAMAIESLPLLAVAGAAAVLSGILAVSAGRPEMPEDSGQGQGVSGKSPEQFKA